MKSSDICSQKECTACSACASICPKSCISLKEGFLGGVFPVIDETNCINCGLCVKTCPNNNSLPFVKPQEVYVGWSLDNDVRNNSASGGIVSSIYKYAIDNNIQTYGVAWDRKNGCKFEEIKSESDIKRCRNSKYVYADINDTYNKILISLKSGRKVFFIGLPCQVSALKCFLNKDYDDLVCIDIVCHGIAPATYLKQHVKYIEEKKARQCNELFFRNPSFQTYTYTFTLEDNRGIFYKKKVVDSDNYQLGYHKCLIYRENCYTCKYAQPDRLGDLTVSDFSGLGKLAPYYGSYQNVSCILENTAKGTMLLNDLNGIIYVEKRPREEAFIFEHQLIAPSTKHPKREIFEEVYRSTNDFVKAANASLQNEKIKALITKYRQLLKSTPRKFIKKILPNSIVEYIKNKK